MNKENAQYVTLNLYPFLFARSTFNLVLQKADQLRLLIHGLFHAVSLMLVAHLQLHDNVMMYTSTRLHTHLPSNVRVQ